MAKHPLGEVFGFTTRDFSLDDDTDEVRTLAKEHNFDSQVVPMKNTHHTKMHELCIGPNLEWLRRALQ